MTSVRPGRTALLLVDVINAFFDQRGAFYYPEAPNVLPAIEGLLGAARGSDTLVVHARESHHPGLSDFEERKLPRHCVAGEFDAEFFSGFEPRSGEIEVRKRRYSAFFATDLGLLLAEQRIDDLVIVGVKTNVCIRASVQDAFAHGFLPMLVRGASNSNRPNLHEAAMEDVSRYFGHVLEPDEALARLGGDT